MKISSGNGSVGRLPGRHNDPGAPRAIRYSQHSVDVDRPSERRWWLFGHDLDRHAWRSFDRLREPVGARAVFRPREMPGGAAAAYVRDGISGRERGLRLTVSVTAPEEYVRRRIGVWGRVDEVAGDRVVLTFEAQDVGSSVFGIDHLDAPDELLTAIAEWRDRLAALV